MVPKCPHCSNSLPLSEFRTTVVKFGSFLRKSDQTIQQRFLCRSCAQTFSTATSHPCFKQKKRHLNPEVFQYLASGISQRRLAKNLKINRKTVVRKFLFLSEHADSLFRWHRDQFPLVEKFEFDDMEVFEHTKYKPLSITLAVESKTRRILGFRVAQMPSTGLLAKKSVMKYGRRRDDRRMHRRSLFSEIQSYIHPRAVIRSDQNPHYAPDVKDFFPQSLHETFKGRRGCVTGQGELKGGGFDPLFSLNHTAAMFRANVNRLFRRTWCTTKKAERLSAHLTLYCLYHNLLLLDLSTIKGAS